MIELMAELKADSQFEAEAVTRLLGEFIAFKFH
jgi:hypothetical protein